MAEKATVATRSDLMETREAQRALPRRLMIGEEALLEPKAAAVYFPREPLEQPIPIVVGHYVPEGQTTPVPRYGAGTIDPWALRIGRLWGRIYNLFAEAVKDAAGQILTKEPKVSEDTPEKLRKFYEDVNGAGANLHTFLLERAMTAISEGIDYVLVDHPPAPPVDLTEAEEERLGIRPTFKVYCPDSVLEIVTEMFRGNIRVKRLRLHEIVEEPSGWGAERVEQIRVLYPGDGIKDSATRYARFDVWRLPPDEKDWEKAVIVPELSGSMAPQVDIPFVPFPTGISETLGNFDSPPPMLALAWKVIGHARKQSTLDNAQNSVGFPVLYWKGIESDDARLQLSGGVGSSRVFTGPPDSDLDFKEPEGSAWESVQKSLDTLANEMQELAKAPRSERADGNVTARGEILGQNRSQVQLNAWKWLFENAANTLAYYAWIYLYRDANPEADKGWGSIELDATIIPDASGQENVSRLAFEANQAGKLSDQTLHEVWIGTGFMPPITFEEERGRLARSGPPEGERTDEDLTGAGDDKPGVPANDAPPKEDPIAA